MDQYDRGGVSGLECLKKLRAYSHDEKAQKVNDCRAIGGRVGWRTGLTIGTRKCPHSAGDEEKAWAFVDWGEQDALAPGRASDDLPTPAPRQPTRQVEKLRCGSKPESTEATQLELDGADGLVVEKLPESLAFLSEIINCQLHRG